MRPLSDRLATAKRRTLRWPQSVRIVSSAYPALDVFDYVGDPDDFVANITLESETNPRILEEVGDLSRIPTDRWAKGSGAGYVMGTFTHVSPYGSRFAAPDVYGVYYASRDEETAIAETVYHRERMSRESKDPPQVFDQRVLLASIRAHVVDLSGVSDAFPDVYDADDYALSQAAGRLIFNEGRDGVAFDSVRLRGGHCVAVFNPSCITDCRHAKYLSYRWDGKRITVFNVSLVRRTH